MIACLRQSVDRIWLALRTCIALLVVSVGLVCSPASAAQSILINPSVNIDNDLITRKTLRAIFSMRLTRWPDGTPITVFILDPESELHIQFCKNELGIFPYQLQRAWDRLVFSGTGQAPLEVQSVEEMRLRVLQIKGAIGYIQEDISLGTAND